MIRPINPSKSVLVYVEDVTTKVYLDELLGNNGKFVEVIVVGGRQSVLGVIEDDVRNKVTRTLGIVDRDFNSNVQGGWTLKYNRVFLLPNHEIENYLLDFDAIASYTPGGKSAPKDASHWQELAHSIAERYVYSATYNRLIAEIQSKLCQNYPEAIHLSTNPAKNCGSDPSGVVLKNLNEVVSHLKAQPWMAANPPNILAGALKNSELVKSATDIFTAFDVALHDPQDSWVRCFPGKEMFRAITTTLLKGNEDDANLVMWIARKQLESKTVPIAMRDCISKIVQTASVSLTPNGHTPVMDTRQHYFEGKPVFAGCGVMGVGANETNAANELSTQNFDAGLYSSRC